MEDILDLNSVPIERQLDKVVDAFESLTGEKRLSVEAKGDFGTVMKPFQDKFWGRFNWEPLSISPEGWKGYLSKADSLTSISGIMEGHHKYCDTIYVRAENLLMKGDLEKGKELMNAFIWNMELHFAREEKILFPSFEERTGMVGGPTQVMRTEHEQIRGVLREIEASLNKGDFQRIYDLSETMLILIQQHNSKEENVLYPMTDQHLPGDFEEIAKQMQLLALT